MCMFMMKQKTKKTKRTLEQKANQDLDGMDTGFKNLNSITSGFRKGELIAIGSAPYVDKNAFASNIVQNALDNDRGAIVFSFASYKKEALMRILSAKTKVPLDHLENKVLDDFEYCDIQKDRKMDNLYFTSDDNYAPKIVDIIVAIKRENPVVSLVVIDNVQCLNLPNCMHREVSINKLSKVLKMLARDLDICILFLGDMALKVNKETHVIPSPTLDDFKEYNKDLLREADRVVLLHSKDTISNDYQISGINNAEYLEDLKVEVEIGTNEYMSDRTELHYLPSIARFVDLTGVFSTEEKLSIVKEYLR